MTERNGKSPQKRAMVSLVGSGDKRSLRKRLVAAEVLTPLGETGPLAPVALIDELGQGD